LLGMNLTSPHVRGLPSIRTCPETGTRAGRPSPQPPPAIEAERTSRVRRNREGPRLVYDVMKQAVTRAREGGGPTLVECKTVRWERHSAISAGKYDNDDAMNAWKRADPIPRLGKVLLEAGVTEKQLSALQDRAKSLNDEAMQFAIDSPVPTPETVAEFVFA
jgi:TPP-dependent pyruvate/acetoin dehydrogenase alpha subunit